MSTNEKQPGQIGLLEGGRGFDRKLWKKNNVPKQFPKPLGKDTETQCTKAGYLQK